MNQGFVDVKTVDILHVLYGVLPIGENIVECLFQRFGRNRTETAVVHFQNDPVRCRLVNVRLFHSIVRIR